MGPRSVGDMKRVLWMRTRRNRVRTVVCAERVLNDAAVDIVAGPHSVLRVDQKPLATHRTAYIRRKLGWLT